MKGVKICIFCNKEIKEDEKKFLLGIEVPYLNLWVHRSCLDGCDDLRKFLSENLEKYLKLYNKSK